MVKSIYAPNLNFYRQLLPTFEVAGSVGNVEDSNERISVSYIAINAEGLWLAVPCVSHVVAPLGFIQWQKVRRLILTDQTNDLWVIVNRLEDFETKEKPSRKDYRDFVCYVPSTGEIAIRLISPLLSEGVVDYLNQSGLLQHKSLDDLPSFSDFHSVDRSLTFFGILLALLFAPACTATIMIFDKSCGLSHPLLSVAIVLFYIGVDVLLFRRIYAKNTGCNKHPEPESSPRPAVKVEMKATMSDSKPVCINQTSIKNMHERTKNPHQTKVILGSLASVILFLVLDNIYNVEALLYAAKFSGFAFAYALVNKYVISPSQRKKYQVYASDLADDSDVSSSFVSPSVPDSEEGLELCAKADRYAQGDGVDKDMRLAMKLYRQASEKGCSEAQYKIGLAFLQGNGVVQDREQAEQWLRKAAALGHKVARQTLLEIIV